MSERSTDEPSGARQELFDRRTFVRREIIGDHVELLATRMNDGDVGEEGNKLYRGATLRPSFPGPHRFAC
jgi:hypothetical protein